MRCRYGKLWEMGPIRDRPALALGLLRGIAMRWLILAARRARGHGHSNDAIASGAGRLLRERASALMRRDSGQSGCKVLMAAGDWGEEG